MKTRKKFAQTLLLYLMLLNLVLSACGSVLDSNPTVPAATSAITIQIPTTITTTSFTATPIAPTPTNIPTDYDELVSHLFKNPTCLLPCWEGITPGLTTVDEAQTLLNNKVNVRSVQKTVSQGNGINYGYLNWRWKVKDVEGYLRFNPDKPVPIVDYIYPYQYIKIDFKLADFIQLYGEPSDIIASVINYDTQPGYNLSLYYSNRGIYLSKSGDKEFLMSKNMTFDRFEVFPLGMTTLKEVYPQFRYDGRAWEGFKDFNYYCRPIGWAQIKDCKDVPRKN